MTLADVLACHPSGGYADCHFLGLYSLTLEERGDVVTRAYVARPGELAPELSHRLGAFLHHAHAYDFVSYAVVGTVVNRVFEPGGDEQFVAYEVDGAGLDGAAPLRRFGTVGMRETRTETVREGENYSLGYTDIHRVEFFAGPSGWFCAVIVETARHNRPRLVYSRTEIAGLPAGDRLYRKIGAEEARTVLAELDAAHRGG